MNRTVYVNLDNAESIRLAFENGAPVEMSAGEGYAWVTVDESEDVEERLSAGYQFRSRKEMHSD